MVSHRGSHACSTFTDILHSAILTFGVYTPAYLTFDVDAIIFAGSGSTAAVQKFATILHLGLFSHSREGSYVCTFPGCQRRFEDEGAVKVGQHHEEPQQSGSLVTGVPAACTHAR
jgi:hypothetical protein